MIIIIIRMMIRFFVLIFPKHGKSHLLLPAGGIWDFYGLKIYRLIRSCK